MKTFQANTENMMLEMVSRDPSMLYTLNNKYFKMPNPIQEVIKLFPNGRWLNIYEVPFFSQDCKKYLKADQYRNWEAGDLSQKLGTDYATFAQKRIKY